MTSLRILRRGPVVVLAALGLSLALGIAPAAAECTGGVDMRGTPVGGQVCSSPEPKPEPKPKPSSKPTKQPRPTATATPTPRASRPASTPAATPTPVAPVFPMPTTPAFVAPEEPAPSIVAPEPVDEQFSPLPGRDYAAFRATGPGLGSPEAGSADYLLRITMLLGLAAGGTLWLHRARVHAWMVGLGDEPR